MTSAVFPSVVTIVVCGNAGSAGSAYGLSWARAPTLIPSAPAITSIKWIFLIISPPWSELESLPEIVLRPVFDRTGQLAIFLPEF
jgi:hypothetical protein